MRCTLYRFLCLGFFPNMQMKFIFIENVIIANYYEINNLTILDFAIWFSIYFATPNVWLDVYYSFDVLQLVLCYYVLRTISSAPTLVAFMLLFFFVRLRLFVTQLLCALFFVLLLNTSELNTVTAFKFNAMWNSKRTLTNQFGLRLLVYVFQRKRWTDDFFDESSWY